MSDLFKSLLQQATTHGARSTAMNPLAWAFGISLSGFLLALRVQTTPGWVLPLLAVIVALFGIAFGVSYFILLFIDRDALRSEKFTLSKMAIEKSVTGDSLNGFRAIELYDTKSLAELPESAEPSDPLEESR